MMNSNEILNLPDDPALAHLDWLAAATAAGLPEPTAMTLATVDAEGRPHARIVLFKGYGEGGLQFFTNYESEKAKELAANPVASLVFHWNPPGRQVRIEGRVKRVSSEGSDAYFASRPRGSQVGAWASPQSRPLASREDLLKRIAEIEKRFEGKSIFRPPHWGGFVLIPERYEFWEQRFSRLHERFVFTLSDGAWVKERLAP